MSTYILMKILESTPSRYDRGIGILTLGKINKVYDRLTIRIKRGDVVLDVGCGTGALTLRAALNGAKVKGIDINPNMLEIAKSRAVQANLKDQVKFEEIGVAELDKEKSESYDAVMSGLCFSELSQDEIDFALKEIWRILKTGGLFLVADEVQPTHLIKRILNYLIRIFLITITYLLTQTTTRAVEYLPERVERAGFNIQSIKLNFMENFIELIAQKLEQTPL